MNYSGRFCSILVAVFAAALFIVPGLSTDARADQTGGPIIAGEFDAATDTLADWDAPKDWHKSHFKQMTEDGVGFVRVSKKPSRLSKTANIPEGVERIVWATQFRADKVKSGPKGWHNPLITVQLKDGEDRELNRGWDTVIKAVTDKPGWVVETRSLVVPPTAKTVTLNFAYNAASGPFDWDWVRLYDAANAQAGLDVAPPPTKNKQPEPKAQIEGELMPQTNFAGDSPVPPGWELGEPWMRPGFRRHSRGFLIVDKIPDQDGQYIQTTAPINPDAVDKVRMFVTMNGRAHRMDDTDDVMKRPRVELIFENADGNAIGESLIIPITGFLTHNATQSIIGDVPDDASQMRMRIVYHGKQGDLTLRNIHVVPATGDEPDWMHTPAHIPAGANAPHPIGQSGKVFPDKSVLKRDPGAQVDQSQASHRITVSEGDDLHAAWDQARQKLDQGQGVKLVIGPGHYRLSEPLVMEELNDAAREAVFVVEGQAPDKVVISGSVTKGFEAENWELVDAERNIYRHDWNEDWGFKSDGYYQPRHVLSHRRELLFINGQRLNQDIIEGTTFVDRKGRVYNSVGLIVEENPGGQGGYTYTGFRGLDILEPGEFAVAELGPGDKKYDGHPYPNSLLIRLPEGMSTLADATIEVAKTPELLRIENKSNLVLRNLVFEHTASHFNNRRQTTAIEIKGAIDQTHDVLLENVRTIHHNGKGLAFSHMRNTTLRNVTIADNGCFGAAYHHLYNGVARNVDVLNNNWRGRLSDATIHSTGGMTWSGERMRFINCKFNGNYGTGWRSDVWVIDVVAEDCQFNNNTDGHGVGHEIGWGPIIHRRCEMIGNGKGVGLTNNRNVTFEDCLILDNAQLAVRFYAMNDRISPPSIITRDMYFVNHNENVVFRNCTIAGQGEAKLIGQLFGQGSIDNYHKTIEQEYTGENNRFWHPTNRDVFETTTGYSERTWTDLQGWQKLTDTDTTSVWSDPK